ncbi:MAG: periplasmic heavy metal sensor [Pseudomonadota bacterium]
MSEKTRPLPLWLSLSVLVNILLIGLIAGFLIGRPSGPSLSGGAGPPGPLRGEISLGRGIMEVVAPAERRSFSRRFRQAMGGGRERVLDRLEARREIIAALREATYDENRIRSALARLKSADQDLQNGLQEEMLTALGELSPDQRSALAEFMSREPDGPRRPGPRPAPER